MILFVIGAVGVLVRRNAMVVFMCVELMLNAVNLAFVAFARMHGNLDGQVIAFFVMVVAAAEVVVGLAILMSIFRTRQSASVDDPNLLQVLEGARGCRSSSAGCDAGSRRRTRRLTAAAVGVQRAAWLLVAFPLAGAVVLLLGGGAPTAGGTCWAWPCRWPRSSTA